MDDRVWYSPDIVEGLTQEDCDILNQSGRAIFPTDTSPSRSAIQSLRLSYVVGMSAADLLTALGYDPALLG